MTKNGRLKKLFGRVLKGSKQEDEIVRETTKENKELYEPWTTDECSLSDTEKKYLLSLTEKRNFSKTYSTFITEKDLICSSLEHAKPEDYTMWLAGYLLKGKQPTHYYNYNFPRDEFYKAKRDFRTIPLYGADSINIIVPEGVKWLGGRLGHIELYFMEDFKNIEERDTDGWVPVYDDIVEPVVDYLGIINSFAEFLGIKPKVDIIGTINSFKSWYEEAVEKAKEEERRHKLWRYFFYNIP